jgi:hypothetical protein
VNPPLIGCFRLVAILIGHLRMNLNDAIDTLLEVASAVFPEVPQQTIDHDSNTKELRKAVEGILEARNIPLNTKMNDPQRPPTTCKVYVSSLSCIPSSESFIASCMPQHRLGSITLKHSVPTPHVARVSTQRLSKQSARRWQYPLTSHR